MFARSVTLFSVFGFKIAVNISWTFIAVLLAWSLAQGFFPSIYKGLPTLTYWWMGVAGVIGLFASIILHELAHSVVGRMYGVKIKGITLWLLGGAAELEDEPPNAKAELYMAIAGPIMSVLLAVLFGFSGGVVKALGAPEPFVGVLSYLGLLNLVLAVFNLIPAFPMDGGRVLRAVIWNASGDARKATRIASRIGSWFGIALMAIGVISVFRGVGFAGMWWFIIGMFVRVAADSAYQHFEMKRILQGESIRSMMTPDPVTVSSDVTVHRLIEEWFYRHHHEFFPVVDNGKLVGCVGTGDIRRIPEEERAHNTVARIMQNVGESNSVTVKDDPMQVLKKMQSSGNSRMLVTEYGKLVGVITLKDLLKLISIKQELA